MGDGNPTVLLGYIEDSLTNKRKIGQKIINSVKPIEQVQPERKHTKTSNDDVVQLPTTSTVSDDQVNSVPNEFGSTSNNEIHEIQQNIDSNSSNISNLTNLDKHVSIHLQNCNVTFNISK